MKPVGRQVDLALLLTSAPYTGREPRSELDIALAALALDRSLEVYFMGNAVLHLVDRRDAAGALLPPGYSAWPALDELGEVGLYAEKCGLQRLAAAGLRLIAPVEPLDEAEMQARWRRCRQVVSV